MSTWDLLLDKYPDKTRYSKFRYNLQYGWEIGLSRPYPARLISKNTFNKTELPLVAKEVLKWHKAGYIFGPVPKAQVKAMGATISHFFAVPKGENAVRPILNLSDRSRIGYSLNSCLLPAVCSVEYIQQLEIIEMLRAAGVNAYLWAKDLQWGYNNVFIRQNNVKYLGFYFYHRYWFYQVLPMGLSSSPSIFTEFMHFPIWAAKNEKPPLYYIWVPSETVDAASFGSSADIMHNNSGLTKIALLTYYLDDILGAHRSKFLAEQQFKHIETILNRLGLKSQDKKARPPAQQQIWLGKLYDTTKQWVELPQEKYDKYVTAVKLFLSKPRATQHEFLSHIGRARHMGTIYRVLNAFARGLETWAYSVKKLTDFIDITPAVARDFEILLAGMKLAHSEGAPFSSFFRYSKGPSTTDITIFTDASLTVGIGGISSTGHYFQQKWQDFALSHPQKRDILWRELSAVFVAIHALAPILSRRFIRVYTDNEAVKWMLIKMRSKLTRPDLQILINKICMLLLKYHIQFWIDYIRGEDNITADALSRYKPNPLADSPFPTPYRLDSLPSIICASSLVQNIVCEAKYLKFRDRAV